MKTRIDKLYRLVGDIRGIDADFAEIDRLPLNKRADRCRELFASRKYRGDSPEAYRIVEKFFGYYERGELEIINPRGGNAQTT